MRGSDAEQGAMFSYVSLEERVPANHALRSIRRMTDRALREMSGEVSSLYSDTGRPSIPPERLLRALLLQVLFTIRSERQLMEQLDYNLLYRWFVGLGMDDAVWNVTVFTKNRDRLLSGEVAQRFFGRIVAQAEQAGLLSEDHFTVDGTLIEAWAGHKSFKPKDANFQDPDDGDFKGQKRSNATHRSTTDPDARLMRKGRGKPALLSYHGHVLMENRNGLVIDARLTQATGTAEREAAWDMAKHLKPGATLAGDKGYDVHDFVRQLQQAEVIPHIARREPYSGVPHLVALSNEYAASQKVRKRVEEIFGWMKSYGLMRKVRHRGLPKVRWSYLLTAAAYNLTRMQRLTAIA